MRCDAVVIFMFMYIHNMVQPAQSPLNLEPEKRWKDVTLYI